MNCLPKKGLIPLSHEQVHVFALLNYIGMAIGFRFADESRSSMTPLRGKRVSGFRMTGIDLKTQSLLLHWKP